MPEKKSVPITVAEHDGFTDPPTKRVQLYGWDGSAKVKVKVDATGAIATTGGAAATEVIAVQASPSSLKMQVGGGSLLAQVEAVDLDIRDLTFAADKVDVSGSSINSNTRPSTFATDKVDASGSSINASLNAGVNAIGSVFSRPDVLNLSASLSAVAPQFAVINQAAAGDTCVVPATASKKTVVLQYALVVGTGGDGVTWKQGTTAVSGQMRFAANGGISAPYSPVGLFQTASGASLYLNSSLGSQVSGHVTYVVV